MSDGGLSIFLMRPCHIPDLGFTNPVLPDFLEKRKGGGENSEQEINKRRALCRR
jgi:hypothetical protein